ncbi:methyltransferase domain-containing protein [Spirosoma sp. HMF3257]|uniref:Methyltransferase domain-containing protein n=1 Tax=Spirosoma telluris TaxID=2183553 RepID=A0A327NU01_9BACT|nr:methyltransferase domain-containing protein [Spirosoma telluris]RAI78043.1 hypothetical protein HMF3257_35225 [Spirosoma telluris]
MESHKAINANATIAFNKQSTVFDKIYAHNVIVDYKRERTRTHLEKQLTSKSKVLELNSGTGEDALYFAQKGHTVHATDISEGMLSQLGKKVTESGFSNFITYEQISFDNLRDLTNKGPYDAIFSNFGGLNCSNNLNEILDSFSDLLKPEGVVTLTIMPSFCLWEFLTILKGNYSLAFRRFFAKDGAKAHIEGVYFLCWYYSPSYITKRLKKDFNLVAIEGLCTVVPPSYFEKFPNKYPKLFKYLIKLEKTVKSIAPFNYIGDYFIITLKKK